jgi:hypothetical protein
MPSAFGQHRQLRADGAVADDAQRLAPDLVGVVGRLEPATAVATAFFSGMPRSSKMASASTSSATDRVLEYGALNTAMPRSRAAFRSTWLVPMQKQPTATSFLSVEWRVGKHLFGQLGARADAHEMARRLRSCA